MDNYIDESKEQYGIKIGDYYKGHVIGYERAVEGIVRSILTRTVVLEVTNCDSFDMDRNLDNGGVCLVRIEDMLK